jgi:O-antigen ligase/polysaccharide polymerase Wzy-like membrane protein
VAYTFGFGIQMQARQTVSRFSTSRIMLGASASRGGSAKDMSTAGSNGAAHRQPLAPGIIVLAVAVAALLAGLPWVWENFPSYVTGYIAQIVALLVGYSYAKAWRLPQVYVDWRQRALLLLSFAVPFQNTFLPKVLRKVLFDSHLVLELLRPEILLIVAVTAATIAHGRRSVISGIPLLLKLAFVTGFAGWMLVTPFSAYPLQSVASGVFDFLALYVVLYIFVANAPSRAFVVHCLVLFVIGCVLVATSQMLAMWSNLCCENVLLIPATADEFLDVKRNVPLMIRAGGNGYGNTDNFASLWVLLVPLLAGLYHVTQFKVAKALLFALLMYAGLLVYSRAGIMVVFAGLAAILAFRLVAYRSVSVFSAAALAFLVLIHASSGLEYHTRGMRSFVTELTEYQPPQAEQDIRPPRPPRRSTQPQPAPTQARRASLEKRLDLEPKSGIEYDRSGFERVQAWRMGAEIATKNLLTGIGYGVYPIIEPDYTAPHTLFLLRLSEGGVLSALSLLLLAAYVPWRLLQMARSRSDDMLEFSCLIAVGCFLLKGIVFGGNFSIGGLIVWGYGVGLCLATSVLVQQWASARSTETGTSQIRSAVGLAAANQEK